MYVIIKDGLYLMKAMDMGVREYVDGLLQSIPTGIYSASKLDAMPASDKILARQLGGEVVNIPTLREVSR